MEINKKPSILAFVAHPDDESIFIGGTLRRCVEAGFQTHVVVLTRGETGKRSTIAENESINTFIPRTAFERNQLAKLRKRECMQAAQVLGLTSLSMLTFPTRQLNETCIPDIEATILKHRPQAVLSVNEAGITAGPGSIDHSWCGIATYIACRNILQAGYKNLYYFAATLPLARKQFDEWGDVNLPKHTYVKVRVADQYKQKMGAAKKHVSQRHVINFFIKAGVLEQTMEYYIPKILEGKLPAPMQAIFRVPATATTLNLLLPHNQYSSSNSNFYPTLKARCLIGLRKLRST